MPSPISPVTMTPIIPAGKTNLNTAADITARYARKALQTLTTSPLVSNANQYGWLLARGAERQIVTSATVHGTGFMGFSALTGILYQLANGLKYTLNGVTQELTLPVLSSTLAGISMGTLTAGLSGLSALYCLDQLSDTIFGKSVIKNFIGHSKKLDKLRPPQ